MPTHNPSSRQEAVIGFVTISDRASQGVYEDKGGPAMQAWIHDVLSSPWRAVVRLIPDEQALIEQTLIELADQEGCDLILTTGGTGPALRDVTPEATIQVCQKMMDGFAEQMRAVSLRYVPTAILSRQVAGIRGASLIINLPGKPSAIGECLEAVFSAVPYCLDLIGAYYIETHPDKIVAFRPNKKATVTPTTLVASPVVTNQVPLVPERLLSIRDFIRWTATQLLSAGVYFGHGMDNAFDEAKFIVYQALSMPPDLESEWLSAVVSPAEADQIQTWLTTRIQTRKPSAYIVGSMWFAGMRFLVNEQVLVPRSPFAELIGRTFDDWIDVNRCEQVLDLCTGSGCIGIASLQVLPFAEIDLVDISTEALAVAEKNIALHGVAERVRTIQSDLFGQLAGKRYDLILSNPPYVDAAEIAQMPAEFHHEPMLGLAAGQDGLDLVRQILAFAADYLTDDGVLMVEVGASDEALIAEYPELPFYWFEFALGGMGVFAINHSELVAYQEVLLAKVNP